MGEYRILDVIGEGGFGIVYRALDLALDREIALKEYMPSTLAGRRDSCMVHVRSQHKGAFDAGLRSFINEARLLARFAHPALVHVYRFFEENSTAYMVMHYYKGETLASALQRKNIPTDQSWASAILNPIFDVLEVLHAADCYHRDISPDNIFLQQDGSPVLLDFGAARRIIGDMTQALTMVLKPGFAPIEQYVDDGAMPQGAWTDIYQLGALMHLMVTGHTPPTSVARMINDPLKALTPNEAPGFSMGFLQAIHKALAVRPADRPQSIRELRNALGLQVVSVRLSSMPDAFGTVIHASSVAQQSQPVGFDSARQVESLPLMSATEISTQQRAETQPSDINVAVPQILAISTATPKQPAAYTANNQHEKTSSHAILAKNGRKNKLAVLVTAGTVTIGLLSGMGLLWWNKSSRQEAEAHQAIQQQALAWEQARAASTIASLQEYLRKFPDGLHRQDAQALLLELSQEALDAAQLAASTAVAAPIQTPASTPSASGSAPLSVTPVTQTSPTPLPASSPLPSRAAAPETMGKVIFRIVPWGYVSVNRGPTKASPPMTQIDLPEGVHQVEISNPGVAQPISQTITVKRGETTVINQKFE